MPVESHSHSGVCTVIAASSMTARGMIIGCLKSSLTLCRSSVTPAMALNSPADNVVGTVIVNATLTISAAILTETALSYVGVGVQPPDTSLGLLVSQYQSASQTRPWLFWWPGLCIISIALTVNFIGDGLRDAFDPKQTRVRA